MNLIHKNNTVLSGVVCMYKLNTNRGVLQLLWNSLTFHAVKLR